MQTHPASTRTFPAAVPSGFTTIRAVPPPAFLRTAPDEHANQPACKRVAQEPESYG